MKNYVSIDVRFYKDGRIIPKEIIWEDGRHFPIDRILDIRRAASLKSGGCGVRYTCRINGHERYLFLEDEKWFIESH